MKYLYTTLLILSIPFLLQAQSNYKPGYVVSLNGDTIKGVVNNYDYEKNPANISILRSDNAQTVQYSAINALAFGIYGHFAYQRSVIWASQDVPGATTMSGADTTQKLDTVFLKVLVSGKNVSLYSYTDRIKTRFFISEQGARPIELIYHEYRDPDQQGTIVKALYKIQLQKLAAKYRPGNQKLIDHIQTFDYKDYALTSIIFGLNGSQAVQVSQPKKTGMRFFAGVNVNGATTSYNSGSTSTDNLDGVAPYHNVSPQVSAGADFFFDKEKQLFVFRLALGITSGKVSFVHNYNGDYAQPDNRYTESLKFNHLDISLAPQIILNLYNSANLKFYLDGGFTVTSLNYSDKSYSNTIYYSATNTTTNENQLTEFPALHSLIVNLPVKAGVVINNRIDIYVGYIPRTDLSAVNGVSVAEYSYQAGINYLFGK